MASRTTATDVSRRDALKAVGAVVAGATFGLAGSRRAESQTPKRGGVFRICAFTDPSGFDPHLTINWWTQINLSFTHSRLLKHKAGPGVPPGTFPVEGDLAESWTQPSDTTYVFKLRRGVRWHGKAPVNGRELTADDVKYTYERFLAIKGNPNRPVLEQLEKIEALDRHTTSSGTSPSRRIISTARRGKSSAPGSRTSRTSCRISATTMAAGSWPPGWTNELRYGLSTVR